MPITGVGPAVSCTSHRFCSPHLVCSGWPRGLSLSAFCGIHLGSRTGPRQGPFPPGPPPMPGELALAVGCSFRPGARCRALLTRISSGHRGWAPRGSVPGDKKRKLTVCPGLSWQWTGYHTSLRGGNRPSSSQERVSKNLGAGI